MGVLLLLLLTSCTFEDGMKADSPDNAGIILKQAISSESTELINELMVAGRKGTISKEQLKAMKPVMTAGAILRTYELLEFDNGEMILVFLSKNPDSDLYEVADFRIVPEEMRELFDEAY